MMQQRPTDLQRLAFLGPEGTYSHQAAYELFGEAVLYLPQRTIAETFYALDHVPLALLPWENSIHGTVVDTLDLLRLDSVGTRIHVRGEIVVAVKHCLVVKRGVKLFQIKKVMSHDQAIGQCTNFLASHLPQASIVRVASTAAGAEMVSKDDKGESAAICSSICARLYHGLEILREGIQGVDDNFTRFILLSTSTDDPLPACLTEKPQTGPRALLRLSIPTAQGSFALLGPLLTSLSLLTLGISRIDRRPSLTSLPFHDTYFVELQGPAGDARPPGQGLDEEFVRAVENSVQRVKTLVDGEGSEVRLLGHWQ